MPGIGGAYGARARGLVQKRGGLPEQSPAATDDPRGTSDTTRRASTNGGVWKGTVPNPHIRSVTQYAVEALSHKSDSVAGGCQSGVATHGFRDDCIRGRNLEHGCPLA